MNPNDEPLMNTVRSEAQRQSLLDLLLSKPVPDYLDILSPHSVQKIDPSTYRDLAQRMRNLNAPAVIIPSADHRSTQESAMLCDYLITMARVGDVESKTLTITRSKKRS